MPAALVRRARAAGVPVSMTYGLTEACSQVTTTPVAAIEGERPSGGPPLFCTRVRIAPTARSSSPGRPSRPARSRPTAGCTPAISAPSTSAGRLRVTGRKADTIVSGGENVAPAEVEAVLEAHPDVLEAAVLGRPDAQWGEAVTAIVVRPPGPRPRRRGAARPLRRSLASFKVPKRVVLPRRSRCARTPSGKLLRRELR